MAILENSLDQKHLIEGEILLESGAVLEVLLLEKKLWSIMVRDNGILEVEVQNPNTKTQKSTCECKIFTNEKSCPHIAAALLHLRHLDTEQKAKRRKQKRETQTKQFNIKTILNSINEEQLKNYVRTYAQKDKNFGTMLKASFAGQLDLNDNRFKYQSILNGLIKPMSTEKLKSTSSDLRLALKVVDEFNAQLEDSLSLSQFENAFNITAATLPKLHYLFSKYGVRNEVVKKWISTFHGHLNFLYGEGLSPKFVQKMDDFVIDLFDKSYYNHLEECISLYQIVDKANRKKTKKILNEKLLNQRVTSLKQSSKAVFSGLLIVNNFFDRLPSNEDTILSAVHYLLKNDYDKEAIHFLENFKANQGRNRKMEFALLSAYDSINERQKYIDLSIELYLTHHDIRIYKNLKTKLPPAEWSDVSERISSMLSRKKINSNFKATFYFNEGMIEELVQVLDTELDIRHIMKYDFFLNKTHFLDIERIYHSAISKYLDTHIGSVALSFIEEVFFHLRSIKAYKLESSIQKFIADKYPHRSSFMSFK